jgi:hypothetical protein
LQRFFYAEVIAAGTGTILTGVIRSRRPVRWFVTVALFVLVPLMLFISFIVVGALISGGVQDAAEPGRAAGVLGFLTVFYLGMTQFAMATTAPNEDYLITWLTNYLS